MNKKYILAIPLVLALITVAYVTGINAGSSAVPNTEVSEGLHWDGYVTVVKTDGKTGEKTILADGKHNTMTDIGVDAIKQAIGNGSSSGDVAYNYIALGNSTLPAKGDTSLTGEILLNGLTRQIAAYTDAGVGNWSLSTTWTTSGTVEGTGILVNTSGVFNTSVGGTGYLAGAEFTDAQLQNDDTINVVWQFNCTGG